MKSQDVSSSQKCVTVIVDAFRAFATASIILSQLPSEYYLTDSCASVSTLLESYPEAILIGKPQIGSSLSYAAPNSPTRVGELSLAGRVVIHRTAAGGLGARSKRVGEIVLGLGFPNMQATADYIGALTPKSVVVLPMGHEGNTPSLEDDLCAANLKALLARDHFDLDVHIDALRKGPGSYFFGSDQWQYPRSDFAYCTKLDSFPSAIILENRGDFARVFTSGPL